MRANLPAALLLACSALTARAEPLVLHEYVPDVDPEEAAASLGDAHADVDARSDVAPASAATSDVTAPAPPFVAVPGDGAFAEEPGRRSPSFRPDRDTSLEGTLDYYATFTPAIAPFKRVTSLDRIVLDRDGRTPLLVVGDVQRRAIPVEGEDAPASDPRARDRFHGAAWLDFSGGLAVPLPSVSPESRILAVETDPPVALALERDGADNHFAVARSVPPPGVVVALRWLTDAPRSYFGSEIPELPLASLAAEAPAVPESVRARAVAFARELGIAPDGELRSALHALAAHFRAFEESDSPPRDTGDLYLDLARGGKGICRHRAYGFVVTAQALGIPTRFVQNEAHAWAEVKLPGVGWLRVDLGGAAHGLAAHGASDRPLHHAAHPDTLPRPSAYEQSYSQLRGDVRGLWRPEEEDLPGRWVEPGVAEHAAGPPGAPTPVRTRPADVRKPLRLAVASGDVTVMRGRDLTVSGRVVEPTPSGAPAGSGVAGLRVEISLAAEGRRERLLLGITETRAGGVFRARLTVPPDLAVGDYRLVVLTPGSSAYLPARGE